MNKEQKAEVLKFLEGALLEKLKMVFLAESEYRSLTSLTMGTSKPSGELMAAQTKAKQQRGALETSIRNLKGVIEEVKNDKLVI